MKRIWTKMASGAGVALILGGAWMLRHRANHAATPPHAGPAETAVTIATAPDAAPARRSARTIQPGAKRTYDVALHIETALLENDKARARLTIQSDLRGRWEVAVIARDGDTSRFRGTFVPASLEMHAGNGATLGARDRDAILRDLTRPFVLQADARGRVHTVQFAGDISTTARGLARAIVAAAQFTSGDGDAWTTEEQDVTGECVTRYVRAGDDAAAPLFEKTKQRYARVATPDGLVDAEGAGHVTLDGGARIALDADGWPAHVDARHTVALEVARMPMARGTTSVKLDLVQTSFEPGVVEPPDLGRRSLLAALDGQTPSREATDARLVGGATLDDLLGQLRTAPAGAAPSSTQDRLAALLRLQPGGASRAAETVIAGVSPESGAAILGALANAGTRESQTALVAVTRSKASIEVRTEAIAALGTSESVNAESTKALTESLGHADVDVRTTSALALGNAAASLTDSDPSQASSIVDRLLALAANPASHDDRLAAIRALGNARDPRALPVLQDAMGDPDPAVRGAAVYALRGIDDATVDALIDATLASDSDLTVRASAVAAMDYRQPAAHLAAVGADLRADTSARVRMALVTFLGQTARGIPGAVDLLKQTAATDASTDVRALAKSFLAS